MGQPDISVLIPARNERGKIATTIRSIARARTTEARVEFVVVDDSSTDDTVGSLMAAMPQLLDEPRIDVRLCTLEERVGTYRCRNHAAKFASADLLFITDAHVAFSEGWDEELLRHAAPDRIVAGTVTHQAQAFRGYGCRLLVPLMRTSWNLEPASPDAAVEVAVCTATALPKRLFQQIGGYDPGMLLYGGGEAEFSVRAWLSGAQVCCLPTLEVEHEFKPREVFRAFMAKMRPFWVHNCIRFGLLYLSELGCLQLLRYYARAFPAYFQQAMSLIDESDLWVRRAALEKTQQHPFEWFVERFGIKNQVGGEII